jgi:hypothetical protein
MRAFLGMARGGSLARSANRYAVFSELQFDTVWSQRMVDANNDKAVVANCGRICIFRKKINLSTSLAGQAVGIKEVDEGIWLVSFMDYDLGYIDLEEKTLQPLNNPFGPKVSSERSVKGSVRTVHLESGGEGGIRTIECRALHRLARLCPVTETKALIGIAISAPSFSIL